MTAPTAAGCAAPDQAAPLPASLDPANETIVTGLVKAESGEVVPVPTSGCSTRPASSPPRCCSEAGQFRFFAAPGDWTLRALAPGGISTDRGVSAATGEIRELDVAV